MLATTNVEAQVTRPSTTATARALAPANVEVDATQLDTQVDSRQPTQLDTQQTSTASPVDTNDSSSQIGLTLPASLPAGEEPNLTLQQVQDILHLRLPTRRFPPLTCNNSWTALLLREATTTDVHHLHALVLPKLLLSVPAALHNSWQKEAYVAKSTELARRNAWQSFFARCHDLFHVPQEAHQERGATEGSDNL